MLPPVRGASAAPLKTLTVCDDVREPATLDPQREFSEKNHTLLQQIFEGLVRFDARGRVEPALAVSWKRLSPLRTRFRLRKGVVFQDGEPFDAEAVRFSIARYLDPATGFPGLGFLEPLEKAEVVDDHTVDLVTRSPDGLLFNRLAGFVVMVPPRYVTANGPDALNKRPIGTGPFRFESREPGRSITLARNRRYWRPGRPRVDRLIFCFIPAERQLAALEAGDVDILTELPGSMTLQALERGDIRVLKAPVFLAVAAGINQNNKALADRRVRLAINYAVNRRDMVFYDAGGDARPIATATLEGEEGHAADLRPYPYDPAKARLLLREAGYGAGLRLWLFSNQESARVLRIVARQLADVGIQSRLIIMPDGRVVKALRHADWDLTLAQCPDPMAHSFFIQSILLYSKSPYCLYRDPDYDRRLEKASSIIDATRRREAFERLDRYVYDRALLLPLYQRLRSYGLRKGVSFTPSVTGMPYFLDANASPR